MMRWPDLAPAAVLVAGVLLASGARSQHVVAPRLPLAELPRTLADKPGTDATIAEAERRAAGASTYLLRHFPRDSASSFTAYVGYYDRQTGGRTIHSPKNCLPGAGWQILDAGTEAIATAAGTYEVNRYLMANGGTRALVLYWYQGRGRVVADEYRVKWNLLRDAAIAGRSEEALVRVVVPIVDRSIAGEEGAGLDAAEAIARTAAAELIPSVARALPAPPAL